jgi:hypothetical protein
LSTRSDPSLEPSLTTMISPSAPTLSMVDAAASTMAPIVASSL